jgi:hypothetical protein
MTETIGLDLLPRQSCQKIARPIQLRVKADISTEPTDPEWDAFLHRWAPCNSRQTTAWLQEATAGSAHVVRTMFYKEGELEGGFQMLIRKSRLMGNIGLVRQGPVILSEDPDFLKLVLVQFEKIVRRQALRFVILEPHPGNPVMEKTIQRRGYIHYPPIRHSPPQRRIYVPNPFLRLACRITCLLLAALQLPFRLKSHAIAKSPRPA